MAAFEDNEKGRIMTSQELRMLVEQMDMVDLHDYTIKYLLENKQQAFKERLERWDY